MLYDAGSLNPVLCDSLEGWDGEGGGREVQEAGGICMCACMLSHFSHVQLFVTPWTTAHESPLSMGFSRQEYWSGWLCPPPGDLPDPKMEPKSFMSPALAGSFFTTSPTWEAWTYVYLRLIQKIKKRW